LSAILSEKEDTLSIFQGGNLVTKNFGPQNRTPQKHKKKKKKKKVRKPASTAANKQNGQ